MDGSVRARFGHEFGARRSDELRNPGTDDSVARVEQLVIRNLPEGIKAALRARAARHRHSVEAEVRAILADALPGEDVPMSVLLGADSGNDIEFEPERLGLVPTTRAPRTFGQLPNLSVPEDFDELLPDAELAGWEGGSHGPPNTSAVGPLALSRSPTCAMPQPLSGTPICTTG